MDDTGPKWCDYNPAEDQLSADFQGLCFIGDGTESLSASTSNSDLTKVPSSTTKSSDSFEYDSEGDAKSISYFSDGIPDYLPPVRPIPVQLHPRLQPADRTHFREVELTTNMFRIYADPNKTIYRYDVCVELVLSNNERESVVVLNRGAKDDSGISRRQDTIKAAMCQALEAYHILSQSGAVCFDGTAILFSNENLAERLKPVRNQLTVKVGDLPQEIRALIVSDDAKEIRIAIRPCLEFSFRIGDVERGITSGQTDRPLRQFYELLTNEGASRSKKYVFFGAGSAYLRYQCPADRSERNARGKNPNELGLERRFGVTKGIRFIEGRAPNSEGRLITALVLDAKRAYFFKESSLLDSVALYNCWSCPQVVQWNRDALLRTHNYVKGLRLQLMDSRNTFVCAGIHFAPGSRAEFVTATEYEEALPNSNKLIPMLEKYRMRNITIKFPDWPLVILKMARGQERSFPIEQLYVCANQRVSKDKALLDPEKARKPDQRWQEIGQHLVEMDLASGTTESSILERFGVRISSEAIKCTGFRRPAPTIRYRERTAVTDAEKAIWRSRDCQYVMGAEADLIWFIHNTARVRNERQMQNSIRRFAEMFLQRTKSKGIKIAECKIREKPVDLCTEISEPDFFTEVRNSTKNRVVVLYIDAKENKTHGYLKFLEVKYQVVTQHITYEAMEKVLTKGSATLDNIIHKFNLKAFGLNCFVIPEKYSSEIWNSNTLIMGYDVAHPTGLLVSERARGIEEHPSVVGFSHNASRCVDSFVGDFAFQQPLRERVCDNLLRSRMVWILESWIKNRGERLPEHIFVYRDGVSEGQYDMVVRDELAVMRDACQMFAANYDPKFVVVVVAKRHNKRFFKFMGRSITNPDALTVVDQEVVRPDITEMFIQSHNPLQGTAKPTQYVLVHSDIQSMTQDILQSFTIALTFQHQICDMPVSIPEPVYQSDEWAKRGADILKTFKEFFCLPRIGEADSRSKCRLPVDWEKFTKAFSYIGKRLDGTRANA